MRGRRSRAESQMIITGSSRKAPLFGADRLHGQRLTHPFTALLFCPFITHRFSPRSSLRRQAALDAFITDFAAFESLDIELSLSNSTISRHNSSANMQAAQHSWGSWPPHPPTPNPTQR